jgi:hypothetical protein
VLIISYDRPYDRRCRIKLMRVLQQAACMAHSALMLQTEPCGRHSCWQQADSTLQPLLGAGGNRRRALQQACMQPAQRADP